MNKVSNFSASLPVLVILFLSLFSLIADILSVVRWLFTIVWKEHLGFKSTQSNSRYFRGHKYIATTVPKPMFAFPLGAMFYMLPNKQAFQGILHPHSRKHNYLAHFFSSPLCFSSQKGIFSELPLMGRWLSNIFLKIQIAFLKKPVSLSKQKAG